MTNKIKFNYDEIEFGNILSELFTHNTLTDIEIREGKSTKTTEYPWETYVVHSDLGRKKLDLSLYPEKDVEELNELIDKIPRQLAIKMETQYNEGNAILDAESSYKNKALLRINSIHQSITGGNVPMIAIRKSPYGLNMNKKNMILNKYCSEEFFDLFRAVLGAGGNVMIAGITGSGKTTLLKYLARYIPDNEAIVTIEDTREAFLKLIYPNKDIGSLKSSEQYGFDALIKASLRQNPEWILVSETRGTEVIDLIEAVGTGHHLISTIHAESVEQIPYRMVNMSKVTGDDATRIFNQVHYDLDLGVYIDYRMLNPEQDEGKMIRQIQQVCEYYIDDEGKPQSHMIYWYDFDENKFKTDFIRSKNIKTKLSKSRTNVSKLKGVFL